MTVISAQGNGMTSDTAQDQQTLDDPRTPPDQKAPEGRASHDQPAPSGAAAKDQTALIEELGTSQESVDALVGELRSLDAQLEALSPERNQHRLLHQVCDALGELDKLGGAQLFWGTREAVTTGELQLGRVRERVMAFEGRVGELEARRQNTREEINRAQYHVGLIEDELFEAQEEEELRQQEWIVEREISQLHSRPLVMPWTWGGEDDRRFSKSLLGTLAVCLLLALVLPFIPLPLTQVPQETQPDQVLHITMALPRPPPPPRLPPPPKVAVQKPIEKPTPQQARKAPTEEPVKPAVETPEPPKPAGLMVFKERLAALADTKIDPELGA